jgi:hypothetical protein
MTIRRPSHHNCCSFLEETRHHHHPAGFHAVHPNKLRFFGASANGLCLEGRPPERNRKIIAHAIWYAIPRWSEYVAMKHKLMLRTSTADMTYSKIMSVLSVAGWSNLWRSNLLHQPFKVPRKRDPVSARPTSSRTDGLLGAATPAFVKWRSIFKATTDFSPRRD